MPKTHWWQTVRKYSEVESMIDSAVRSVKSMFYYELKQSKRENGIKLSDGDLNSYMGRMETLMKTRMQALSAHYEKKLKAEIQRVEDENRLQAANPYAPKKPHQKV